MGGHGDAAGAWRRGAAAAVAAVVPCSVAVREVVAESAKGSSWSTGSALGAAAGRKRRLLVRASAALALALGLASLVLLALAPAMPPLAFLPGPSAGGRLGLLAASPPPVVQRGPTLVGRTPAAAAVATAAGPRAGEAARPSRGDGDVPFFLSEVRAALPQELFVPDEGQFLQYVAVDYLRIAALAALGAAAIPALDYNPLVIAVYALLQGTLFVGPWELGHQCNHGAFSNERWANDLLGAWLHTTLLMPYWSWQYSHAHHHKWPNHVYEGEGACPKVAGVGGRASAMDRLEAALLEVGPEAWAVVHLLIVLVLGWWGYIFFGISGAPAWGEKGSSLFFAPNGMFPADRVKRLEKHRLSLLLLSAWVACLAAAAWAWSPALVGALYVAPYLVCNVWLIVIVLLQHTREDLPHFGSGERYAPDARPFTLERGVFYGTVDRLGYGWLGSELHHEAGSYHVLHHLFPQIPFFKARSGTEALDRFLASRGCAHLRKVDETPIPQALWEVGLLQREVAYSPTTGDYRYLVAGRLVAEP